VIELTGGEDSLVAARAAAEHAEVLGVCGGDGTLAAAAQAAVDADKPLLVFPGGTMNHLALDLGVRTAGDAADALARGEAARIDVASVGDEVFLNNATLGAHTVLIRARRQLEGRIGRTPAQVVGAVRAVLAADPVEVVLDGRRTALWLGFIGNGAYHERGIAPGWRRSLAAGSLDVRLLDAARHRSRVRALLALLLAAGGLGRGLSTMRAPRLRLEPVDEPLSLTRDGETVEVEVAVSVTSHPGGLVVYAPQRDGRGASASFGP
jgi:undecaprenyl-diphosphatase